LLAGLDFIFKTSHFQGDKNFLVGIWGLVNQRSDLGNDRTALGLSIEYPNDLWDISLTLKRMGRDFDPSLGFVPWKGIQRVNVGVVYKPRPEWPWLRQMMHELFAQWVWDIDGTLYQYRIFTAPINWRLESGDRVEFNWVPTMEFLPVSFELSPGVDVEVGTYRWTRYRLEFHSASKRPVTTKITWWFGSFYGGHMDQIQAQISWRPSHKLNLALEGDINRGRMPSGLSDIRLLRTRFDVYFSPNFQVRSMMQYDNLTHSLGLNTRLRWTYRSLLDIFFVFNRNWIETQGRFYGDLNQVFLKVQYSLRR